MSPENSSTLSTPDVINPVLKHFEINPEVDQIPGNWLQPGTIICVQYPDDDDPLWLCVLPINQTTREFDPINHQNRIIHPISENAPLIQGIEQQLSLEMKNPKISLQISDTQINIRILEIITPNGKILK